MRKFLGLWLILCPVVIQAQDQPGLTPFFLHIAALQFDSARQDAATVADTRMRHALLQLADVLYYEGQRERSHFTSPAQTTDPQPPALTFIQALNTGYISLFYDRDKGDAYRHFYQAYQLAKTLDDPTLVKAALLAFFKYYNSEIGQVSESYRLQLDHFETLKETTIDETWLAIYRMVYYSKIPLSLGKLDDRYYQSAAILNDCEKRLEPHSPVLAHVYYEKAIMVMIDDDVIHGEQYFRKVIDQARDYPFLKDERFSSYIKLLILEAKKKNFDKARHYLTKARSEINSADTLLSHYFLNVYSALNFYSPQHRYDSAFLLLKKAFHQEFALDFRRTTLEISRLNVELDTQEKENANLRLRQTRIWLLSSLAGVALLALVSYLAYINQRSKTRIQAKEKEVQIMKLDRVLKDQELFGIDAMLEGQEKERQRLAHELHDNLGGLLATVKLHFHTIKARRGFDMDTQGEAVMKMAELLEDAYQQVRTMAHTRNAGVNTQDGLLPAIENFAAKASISNKLTIDVQAHGIDRQLDNSREITIFRIVQELITNVIKHANASAVTVHVTHHANAINLRVEDNGTGFNPGQVKPKQGMGIHSIQRRVENLGGIFKIDSAPGRGTAVIIDIPLT